MCRIIAKDSCALSVINSTLIKPLREWLEYFERRLKVTLEQWLDRCTLWRLCDFNFVLIVRVTFLFFARRPIIVFIAHRLCVIFDVIANFVRESGLVFGLFITLQTQFLHAHAETHVHDEFLQIICDLCRRQTLQ